MSIYVLDTVRLNLKITYSYFRNAEQMKALWKLSGISEKSDSGGKGVLFSFTVLGIRSRPWGVHARQVLCPSAALAWVVCCCCSLLLPLLTMRVSAHSVVTDSLHRSVLFFPSGGSYGRDSGQHGGKTLTC